MKLPYRSPGLPPSFLPLLLVLMGPLRAALAQSPTIIATVPTANAGAVPRSGPVSVTFSHPLTAASAGALRVFSSQRGGLRTQAQPAVASGSMLRFAPTNYDFRPGEKVSYTISRAAASSGGGLVMGRVVQFTTAVSGSGQGVMVPGSNVSMSGIGDVATGDVDGDGDLDILLANPTGNVVSRLLNGSNATGSNTGTFGNSQPITAGNYPFGVALADVDGDGDLDLLTANTNSSTVSVCRNGGDATGSNTGNFGSPQSVAVGSGPRHLAVGDVDGDGDLDVLTTNLYDNTVSVRLNGGDATGSNTGIFSNGSTVPVGNSPSRPALGDLDNDGDLDLVVTNPGNDVINIVLNGGDATGSNTGTFSNGRAMQGANYPDGVALGDLDGDGDLDMVIGGLGTNYFTVYRNGGDATGSATGIFSNLQAIPNVTPTGAVALGDVDADGDLDVVVSSSNRNYLTVGLNGNDASGSNTGLFATLMYCNVAGVPSDVVLGDLDGDGDLDALSSQFNASTASVRLNGGSGPLAAVGGAAPVGMLLAYPNPAHTAVAVSGAAPNATITVHDAVGRPVLTARANADGAAALDLPAGLAPGLYLVRTGHQVRRLAVE